MAFDYIGMTHTFRATHDYFINDKNIIGVIVNGSLREDDNSSVGDSFTDTYYKENLISRIKSDNISKSNFDNIGGNLNYTHKFDENKGQELTFNADYYYYDIGGNNYQENKPVDLTKGAFGDDTFRIASNQYLNIISTKADYEQVFWKTGRLETGLKWAQTHTDNNTIKENLIDSEWVKDPSQSNKFIYNEQIAAGYISATKMFGQKWVVKLGVRGEYTYSVGDWKTAGDKTTKNYFNVFPTGYLGYTPSQNWRYSLSYALRIERPGYSQLNPYREYIDANTAMEGNPYLNPQYTDQLSLSVGFKSYLNLALIYQHTRDLIMQNSFYEESTGLKLMKWDNFGTMNMCGAALSITEVPIFKWMIFNGNIFGAYIDNKSSLSSLQNTGFMTSAYLNLTFVLPKDWKIEVGGWGQGKIPIASIIADPAYSLFAGVKKNFLDNKATISLNVTDLLRSQSNTIHMLDQTGFRYYTINQINNVQKVKLSFTYRFGQSKATKRRNVGNLDESSRVGGSSGISTGFEQK